MRDLDKRLENFSIEDLQEEIDSRRRNMDELNGRMIMLEGLAKEHSHVGGIATLLLEICKPSTIEITKLSADSFDNNRGGTHISATLPTSQIRLIFDVDGMLTRIETGLR